MYHECVTEDLGSSWCPTEVNNHLGYVNGEWGICGQGCPGTSKGISELLVIIISNRILTWSIAIK